MTEKLSEETRTYSLQGRVQVVDYPYGAPSKCVICGGGPEAGRKFVDLRQSLEYYGAVYYCTDCMGEVAQQVGYVPAAWLQELKEIAEIMAREYTSDLSELKGYQDAVDSLRNYGIVFPDIPRDEPSLPGYGAFKSASSDKDNVVPAESNSGSDKSSGSKRSDNVPSTTAHQAKRSDGL